jgi:pimeloyl-ACP methyl ester carboxylesterase
MFPGDGLSATNLYLHVPPDFSPHHLRILIALHGMGDQGDHFAADLVPFAEADHWVVIAPTIVYGNNFDADQVRREDLALCDQLAATLDELSATLDLPDPPRAYLLGFSRCAQLAHHFALLYPENVRAVAVFSAGAYALPQDPMPATPFASQLPFPYGIGDLQETRGPLWHWDAFRDVAFWAGVGGADTREGDVSRTFDDIEGKTRVTRAMVFRDALESAGVAVHLPSIPELVINGPPTCAPTPFNSLIHWTWLRNEWISLEVTTATW